MKILFLPFLQMPTGHHQVADALIRSVMRRDPSVELKKVDFLSFVNEKIEKIFTTTYLKWIDHSPQTFTWVYRYFVYPSNASKHFHLYESLFLSKMLEMLKQENPDLIVCTQAFPSFLISRLKLQEKIETPVINVYTDFFINKLWGLQGIDYHFVCDRPLKEELISKGIPAESIFITGIPVDECFLPKKRPLKYTRPYHLLISGGNSGLGDIQTFLKVLKPSSDFRYSIMCGKNEKLYREISSLGLANIRPLPYLSSRQAMDDLYNEADAIITKPGGVTISEALIKSLPIFVHSTLPGQEEVNLHYLESHGLVRVLQPDQPIEEQVIRILSDHQERTRWYNQVNAYRKRQEGKAWEKILEFINSRDLTYSAKGEERC
ncbi:glycosyl transferase [Paradesulfitobacterium aromaticivorans]